MSYVCYKMVQLKTKTCATNKEALINLHPLKNIKVIDSK